MAEQTLADFARSIGVTPATARQWKKRGKIVECDSGFELVAQISADGLILSGVTAVAVTSALRRDSGVTAPRPEPSNPELTELRRENKALRCDVETYKREVNLVCKDVQRLKDGVTALEKIPTEDISDKPIEKLSRVEVLERDNRIFSQAIDSLSALTTDQGRMLSQLAKRIEALEPRVERDVYALTRRLDIWENLLGGLVARVGALEVGRLSDNSIDQQGPEWGA